MWRGTFEGKPKGVSALLFQCSTEKGRKQSWPRLAKPSSEYCKPVEIYWNNTKGNVKSWLLKWNKCKEFSWLLDVYISRKSDTQLEIWEKAIESDTGLSCGRFTPMALWKWWCKLHVYEWASHRSSKDGDQCEVLMGLGSNWSLAWWLFITHILKPGYLKDLLLPKDRRLISL